MKALQNFFKFFFSASNSGTPNRFLLKDPHTNRQHVAKKSIFDPLSCNDDDLDGVLIKTMIKHFLSALFLKIFFCLHPGSDQSVPKLH